nr:sigma-70 family RNA polymerase sigma factor [uncultured Oscillibacter sp.]
MTDAELLAQWRADPAAGMEALPRQYGPLLRYVVGGVLWDKQDAEDCLSEVSLALWQRLDGYDAAKGGLASWLTAVARNTALNHRKARQRREAHQADEEPSSPATPEQELLRRERIAQLRTAIGGLRERDRQLFYRKYYYLQSTAQIAAELGMTERAVEGRLYRLRQRLRQTLGGDGT